MDAYMQRILDRSASTTHRGAPGHAAAPGGPARELTPSDLEPATPPASGTPATSSPIGGRGAGGRLPLRLTLGARRGAAGFDQDVWAGATAPRSGAGGGGVPRAAGLEPALLTLTLEDWLAEGYHPERGFESVDLMVRFLAGHDINHLAQLESLVALCAGRGPCARARGRAGPVIGLRRHVDRTYLCHGQARRRPPRAGRRRREAPGVQGLPHRRHEADAISRELAERHYGEHEGKPFYEGLVSFITSGPVVAMVVEGENAILEWRKMMGATNPKEAAPGTCAATSPCHRRERGPRLRRPATAEREIGLFFERSELLP